MGPKISPRRSPRSVAGKEGVILYVVTTFLPQTLRLTRTPRIFFSQALRSKQSKPRRRRALEILCDYCTTEKVIQEDLWKEASSSHTRSCEPLHLDVIAVG